MLDERDLYWYRAKVVRVVDGDTLELMVDCGLHAYRKIRVRLLGIDTPEKYGVKHSSEEYKLGLAASAFTEKWCEDAEYSVIVRTVKTGHGDKKGGRGRYLAEVFRAEDDLPVSLTAALKAAGHVKAGDTE